MENLKAQEKAIDSTPQAKADANKVIYGDIGLETLPNLPNLNSKNFRTTSDFVKYQQYKGEVEGPNITPDEFSSWESDLDYGLRPGVDQNEVRAGNQDWAGELGTGLVKMGTEVTLGSLSSISLIPQTTAQFFGAQQDYSNSISEALDEYKAELNEKYGKTYVSAENAGFAPTSWEFWMNNSGNVATTLSLMIPTWGFTKALGAGARALKIEQGLGKLAVASKEASLLGKTSKWAISRPGKEVLTGLAAASFSRNIESTMEASQTFKETKEQFKEYNDRGEFIRYKINPTTKLPFTEDEVNRIAGEAASSNYKKNWAMLAQDFLQYRHMFKGMDHARRAAQETVKKGLGKSALGFVGQAASEGGEEAYQYISSKESIDTQLVEAGLKKESNWTDRYLKYAEDDEFKTSVLLGTVGASVMTLGGKALNAISPYISKESRENKELLDKAREAAESVQEAAEAAMTGDAVKFDTIKYNSFVDNVIGKAREGKLADLETELETMLNDTDESIEAQGHDPKEYRENVANALRIAKIGGEHFNTALNDPTIADAVAPAYTRAKMYVQYAQDIQKTVSASRAEAEQKDLEVFKLKEEETAAQMLELQKLVNSSSYATNPADHAKAEELANNIVTNSKGAYKSTTEVLNALDTVQVETYDKLRQQEAEIKEIEAQAKATVAALKTKEGQEEYLKDVAKARRAKKAASDLVDSGVVREDSAGSVAQSIAVAEEVIAAAKPDLNPAEVHTEAVEMVTSVVTPKASGDTFKVGDRAVNARGKEHEVLEVDAEGNITKAKRVTTSSDTAGPDIIITNSTHLAAFKKVVAPAEIIQPEEKGTATSAVEEVPAPVADQISALFGPEPTLSEAVAAAKAEDIEAKKADIERIMQEDAKNIVNNRQEIEYETTIYDPTADGNKRKVRGKSTIIDLAGRKVVVLNVNGMNVPFYLSTGHGGKADVTSGKWYPIFGISTDGWMNKLSGKEINDYYGSVELREISETLDSIIGDIRDDNSVPKAGISGSHIDFINKHLTPTENGLPTTRDTILRNIELVKNHLKSSGVLIEDTSNVDPITDLFGDPGVIPTVDKQTVNKPKESDTSSKYRGLDVVNTDITSQTGEPGAAQFDAGNKIIKVNRELLQRKFEERAWTKPRKQKDGTYADPLPHDIFTSYKEWENFVLEHEYQYSVVPQYAKQSWGEYETSINNHALSALSNSIDPTLPQYKYYKVHNIEIRRKEALKSLRQHGGNETRNRAYGYYVDYNVFSKNYDDVKDDYWKDKILAYNQNREEAIDKINAKYDAEIAALKNKSKAETTPVSDNVLTEEVKPTPPAHVLPQGEYETVNFEFSTWEPNPGWKNFGTKEKPNWRLVISEDNPVPAKVTPDPAIGRITNGAGIDFKEAARPMQPGKTIPVFLRHNVLDNGRDSIGVFTADGRMLAQLRMGPGFNSLMAQVKKSGNNLPAQIVKKYTSLGGSLANVTITSGAKYRRTLGEFFSVNSELMVNGEIFIGSSKDSNIIQFFGNKGSKEIKNFSDGRIAEAAAKGANELAGSTFMLMKDPNGQTVIVKLNETKIKDASIGGKTYADITNENIDKALAELQNEVDATIDPAWTPQQLEDYKKTGIGDLKDRFKEVAHEYVRLIEDTNTKGKENANHFELNIGFAKGTNKLEVFMSVRDNTGKKVTSNNREAIATRLGDQFFDMSISKMSNPEYVNEVVNNGFVMTDVYVERPWVNPQLTVRVGESSVVDMNNDAAVEIVTESVADVVVEEPIVTPKDVSTPTPKGFDLDALNIFDDSEEEIDSTSPVQLPNSNKGKEVTAKEVPGDINALGSKLTDAQKEDAIKNTRMEGC